MEETELYNLLVTLNYPVAYDHFDKPVTQRPFLLYRNDSPETFNADNKTYYKCNHYIIDLITDKKDVVVEKSLEALLNNNNLPYEKEEDFIDSEKIYQISYFI